MNEFFQNLQHVILAVVIIGACSTLAALGVITGGEALTVILGVGGFSLGVAGSSVSLSAAAAALPAVSSSSGGTTTTIAPSAVHVIPTPSTAQTTS